MTPDSRPSAYNNAELDAASTIRFDEPRRVPVGLLAGLGLGVLLVCLIVFFVMYKMNAGTAAKPAARAPAVTGPTAGSAGDTIKGQPITGESGQVIPGAVKEDDGDLTVTNAPSKCTFLEVHLKNLAEMERDSPSPENKGWIEGKRQIARDQMARLGCK